MRVGSPFATHITTFVAVAMAMIIIGASGSTMVVIGQSSASASSPSYQDHGFSAMGMNDRITFSLLERATNNDLSVGSLEQFVKQNLLNYDVRRVLLDIGWANYTVGHIPYESWVSNWFTACDSLGVQNVLFVGQLTSIGIGSPWVMSLIYADPGVQTYYPSGSPAPYLSPDNPDVTMQLERDLATLYSLYGPHPSWVGIGTGSDSQDPYYGSNSTMPTLGYSNATLATFANSQYFTADVNYTGYDTSGTLDALWAEFRNFQLSTLMSSGNWQLSNPISVFGTISNGSALAMRFYLPASRNEIQVEWYGNRQGNSSGSVMARILNDTDGKPDTNLVVSSQTQAPSSITSLPAWQGPLTFRGNFTRGYYWAYLSSPATNRSDSYQIYIETIRWTTWAPKPPAPPQVAVGPTRGSHCSG